LNGEAASGGFFALLDPLIRVLCKERRRIVPRAFIRKSRGNALQPKVQSWRDRQREQNVIWKTSSTFGKHWLQNFEIDRQINMRTWRNW
jgi:hypothetical protein